MKKIPLANGRGFALVDDDDYERVSKHGWCLHEGGGNRQRRYASANIKRDGVWKRTLLHRFVMGAEPHQRIDHCNNDGLDCRKENLRFATRGQNQHNSEKRRGRFKGVHWHASAGKWTAQIMANRVYHYLGLFTDEEEAARAYDAKAKELHGEYARVNFRGNTGGG